MVSWRRHLVGYWVISVFLVLLILANRLTTDYTQLIAGFIMGTFYTLLPDIDHPSSKSRKKINILCLLTASVALTAYLLELCGLWCILLALAIVVFLTLLYTLKHRGIMHKTITGIILSLPLAYLGIWISGLALTGYLTHLWLDW